MGVTTIEWCDYTFNHVLGCSEVPGHPGCAHCYARTDMQDRRRRVKWGPHGTRSRTSEAYWKKPLKWNREAEYAGKRRRVFCASLADVFEDWQGDILDSNNNAIFIDSNNQIIPDREGLLDNDRRMTMNDCRRDLFELIDQTQYLNWLLLTKRPENVVTMWPVSKWFPNVWIGASVSNQKTADEIIPKLFECRRVDPRVIFLSVEPLLGPIDLSHFLYEQYLDMPARWVIVGGESGPKARACKTEWIRSIINECRAAEIPCFTKQMGSNIIDRNDSISDWPDNTDTSDLEHPIYHGADCRIRLKDKKGGSPEEWPEDLRVRQFPTVRG